MQDVCEEFPGLDKKLVSLEVENVFQDLKGGFDGNEQADVVETGQVHHGQLSEEKFVGPWKVFNRPHIIIREFYFGGTVRLTKRIRLQISGIKVVFIDFQWFTDEIFNNGERSRVFKNLRALNKILVNKQVLLILLPDLSNVLILVSFQNQLVIARAFEQQENGFD